MIYPSDLKIWFRIAPSLEACRDRRVLNLKRKIKRMTLERPLDVKELVNFFDDKLIKEVKDLDLGLVLYEKQDNLCIYHAKIDNDRTVSVEMHSSGYIVEGITNLLTLSWSEGVDFMEVRIQKGEDVLCNYWYRPYIEESKKNKS
jgi:hypothetical protein